MKIKISGLDSLRKELESLPEKMMDEVISEGFDVKCSECGQTFHAHEGLNTCPNCGQQINLTVEVKQ